MLRLVVSLEPIIGRKNFFGDDEIIPGCIKRPEVRPKNHNAEVEVGVFGVSVLHTFFELIR